VPMMDEASNMNLNSIIYATDFSLGSQNAGRYASRLAGYLSAKLFVTHAFTLSQPAMEMEIDSSLISQQRKDLQFLLSRKAFLLASVGVPASPTLLEGDPKKVLPKFADEHAPSMIILGTHGGGWAERGVLGSVAEEILRSTQWPCLTVGPQVPSISSALPLFDRILYATDLGPAAAHAASYAASFAETFRSRLDVLTVIHENEVQHPDRLTELQDRFYAALDQAIPEQARKFCDPRTIVTVGKAHDQILKHIEENLIDLLVLGVRKTTHLHTAMRMSGVFPLILDATCPVLTITAAE
jgi:nucleotide-binding universal stress UspA family protein